MTRKDYLIKKLELKPHPEGGYFRETYRSKGIIRQISIGTDFKGDRIFSTCIYFLLTADEFSAFHKLAQDEIWHFYEGSPIEMHMISSTGEHSVQVIGTDLENGHSPQFAVPGGTWFASGILNGGDYALVGCTVSPGFNYRDFELGHRAFLVSEFPQHEEIITKYTRK